MVEEVVPNDWKIGDLIKIPKKGDIRSCDNYRGISLLSVPGKVLNRVVLERLWVAVDPNLRKKSSRIQKRRVIDGPNCDASHYNRTISRMEFGDIRQFHQLRESVRQFGKRKLTSGNF